MRVAYFHASVEDFLRKDEESILGTLVRSQEFSLEHQQRGAWLGEINLLKRALVGFERGYILLEFVIPRMGKRADVVLLIDGAIFVIEFKVGAGHFAQSAIEQVHDYALDLKNFHKGSHNLPIVPVLVATEATFPRQPQIKFAPDGVAQPALIVMAQLPELIKLILDGISSQALDVGFWLGSGYQPTPTIVEAAQALYRQHAVAAIARSDAGAKNLSLTTDYIATIIDRSKSLGRKAICFVTGVPGAGKTLVGLNVATQRAQSHSDEHAVYLSGNGPLVTVLREALARDEVARNGGSKANSHRKVCGFIQNIHHFRDEALNNLAAPHERVVVFDEAQRAWSQDQASKFMKKKRDHLDFNMSEPEFLISVMDRHDSWCVVVCLVGEGQEINTGEAGLRAWLTALESRFSHWDVYISNRLDDGGCLLDQADLVSMHGLNLNVSDALHLGVSMRSFRAEALSNFIGHLVENRPEQAREIYREIKHRYPILLTRDLSRARQWLRNMARGSERFGLIASAGGHRLRPEGVLVKDKVDAAVWFLNDRTDVRSSFYLEEVATEFDVQGLELDWAGICWDADFRFSSGKWSFHNFRGTAWQRVNQLERQHYLRNAYRVILTRARQGMVIFVPTGSDFDPTRPSSYYDETFSFLKRCGIEEFPSIESGGDVITSASH